MSRADNYPELLSGREARELIGISWGLWEALLEDGNLPNPVKIADRWKWRKSDLLKWVEDRKSRGLFA